MKVVSVPKMCNSEQFSVRFQTLFRLISRFFFIFYSHTLLRIMAVLLETSAGDITIDLFVDEAPLAATNFLKLCKIKFFNYQLFHNVQVRKSVICVCAAA